VREIVFKRSWDGDTYTTIAIDSGYDAGYVKDIGAELWRSYVQQVFWAKKFTTKE